MYLKKLMKNLNYYVKTVNGQTGAYMLRWLMVVIKENKMSNKLDQKMIYCKRCDKDTIHYRNNKEINWIMHLVLIILTVGIWLIPFALILIWHGLTKPIGGGWVCLNCGEKT